MTISTDTVVSRSPDHVFNDIDGEIVLLSIETGTYYGFNEVLSYIWSLMEEPVPVSVVIDKAHKEFDVEREECEREVLEVFSGMLNDQLH